MGVCCYISILVGVAECRGVKFVPPTLSLAVDNIFNSSCCKVAESSVRALKESLTIRFAGEAGMVRILDHCGPPKWS